MQGDPAQQKMMLYFMPAMFTVFMLFLPAGLGVYMFTNGVLGILQQQAVEWHARRALGGGKGDIKVKVVEEARPGDKKTKRGQGDKETKRGRGADGSRSDGGDAAKVSSEERLLGKGKA